MADNKQEIRVDIVGDASRYTRALAEAQARQIEFFAKTERGQKQSVQYDWHRALVEDQQKNLAASAKYMSDWSDALIENSSKISWNMNKVRQDVAKPIKLPDVQASFSSFTEALSAKAAAVEQTAGAQQNVLFTSARKAEAEKTAKSAAEESRAAEGPEYSQFDQLRTSQAEQAALQVLEERTRKNQEAVDELAKSKLNLKNRTEEALAAQLKFNEAAGVKATPKATPPIPYGTAAPTIQDVQSAQLANVKAKVNLENLQEEATAPTTGPTYGTAQPSGLDLRAAKEEVNQAKLELAAVESEAQGTQPPRLVDQKSGAERQKFFSQRSALWQDAQVERDHELAIREDQERSGQTPQTSDIDKRRVAAEQRSQLAEQNLRGVEAARAAPTPVTEATTSVEKSVEIQKKLSEAEAEVQSTEQSLSAVRNALNATTQTTDATISKTVQDTQRETEAQRQYQQIVETQKKAASEAPAGGASDSKLGTAAPSLQQVKEAEAQVTEAAGQLDAELTNQAQVVASSGQASEQYSQSVQKVQQAEQTLQSAQQNATAVKAAYQSATDQTRTSTDASRDSLANEGDATQKNVTAANSATSAKRTMTSAQSGLSSATRGAADAAKVQQGAVQGASAAITQMATRLKQDGLSAEETASALKNMGFSARETAAALAGVGFTAEEMGEKAERGAEKGRQAFFRMRASAQGAAAVLSGGSNSLLFGITRMAAASAALGPILEAAFPVIGIVVLIDFLTQVPDLIDKIIDKLAGWGKVQQEIFSQNLKDVSSTVSRYDQLAQRQAEDKGTETEARTHSKAAGLSAENAALGEYQQKLAETQKQFTEFKGLIDTADFTKTETRPGIRDRFGKQGAPSEVAIPNLDTDTFKNKVNEQTDIFNNYLSEIEKKTKQPQVYLDPIDWKTSDKTIRENLKKMSDQINGEIRKMMEGQVDVSEHRDKLGPQTQRAAGDEEIKRFTLNEELKTEVMARTDEERITSAQAISDKIKQIDGASTTEYLQSQVNVARVTKQVHDAEFAEFRTTAQDRVDELRSSYDTESELLKQKYGVALVTYGAESSQAKQASEAILDARKTESSEEIGQLNLVLIEAVRVHGLQSEEARSAYGAIVKAARAATDEQRKLHHELHVDYLKEVDEEIALSTKKSLDEVEQARKNYDVQVRIQEDQVNQEGRRGAKLGGPIGTQVEEDAMQKRRALLDQQLAMDRSLADQEFIIRQKEIEKETAALDKNDKDLASKKEAIQKQIEAAEQQHVDALANIDRKGALEREKLDDQEMQYREQKEQQYLHAWMSMWDTMLFRAHSFGQAMQDLWQAWAKAAINAILKVVGQFVVSHIYMRAIDALTHTQMIQNLEKFLIKKLALEKVFGKLDKKGDDGNAKQAADTTKLATADQQLAAAQAQIAITAHTATAALAAEKVPMPVLSAQINPLVKAEQLLVQALTDVAAAGSAATGALTSNIGANAGLAESDIGTAAAIVFLQAIENIPFPANIAAAPALAAATYSEGAPYAAAASAEGGWDLPSGGPFPTILHAREMVLPAAIAESVRNMSNQGGDFSGVGRGVIPSGDMANILGRQVTSPSTLSHPALPSVISESIQKMNRTSPDYARQVAAGGGTNTSSVSNPHFHFHQGDVHALDGEKVGEVMSKSPATFVKMVQSGLKRGAFGNFKTIGSKLR